MKYAYSDEFSYPPALILPTAISIPRLSDVRMLCRAKLDTAADISAVPRTFVERYKPPAFNTLRIRQTGRREHSYLLHILLDGREFSVEAIAHKAPYVLVGRDILNQLKLIADGPNEAFELIHAR